MRVFNTVSERMASEVYQVITIFCQAWLKCSNCLPPVMLTVSITNCS